MRFFTALMACALVMGACSQAAIEPASDGSGGTRAPGKENEKVIVFQKVVQNGDEQIPAEPGQFKFELWGDMKNGKGEPTYFGTWETGENGFVRVKFSDLKGQGRDSYYFVEVFDDPEERAQWVDLGDLPFTMQASWGTEWDEYGDFDFGEGPVIVNIPVPEPAEGFENNNPVTLTNDANNLLAVVKNGKPQNNHFYAVLDREVLENDGRIKLDMITPGNHADVGDAFVKLEGDQLVIYVEYGELDGQRFEVYNGNWKSNGNDSEGLTMDYPAGTGDFCIYFRGHYSY